MLALPESVDRLAQAVHERLGLDARHVYDDAWQPRRCREPRRETFPVGDLDPVDELPDHRWVRSASEVYRYRRRIDGPVMAACLVWPGKRRAMVRPSRHGLVAGIHGGVYSWDPRQHVWRRGRGSPTRTFPTTRLPFYRGEHVIPKLDDDRRSGALVRRAEGRRHRREPWDFRPWPIPAVKAPVDLILARQLAGHDVVIIFDNDETGRTMGPKVATAASAPTGSGPRCSIRRSW